MSPGFSFENPVFVFDDSKEVEDLGGVKGGDEENSSVVTGRRVFSVRLGKLKSNNGVLVQESEVGETSGGCSNLDGRRCYSMGSFQYVVADSELQVALCPSGREREAVRTVRVRGGGGGGQNWNFTGEGGDGEDGKKINSRVKGESFSVSKIWLWSKKGKFPHSTDAHCSNYINASLP